MCRRSLQKYKEPHHIYLEFAFFVFQLLYRSQSPTFISRSLHTTNSSGATRSKNFNTLSFATPRVSALWFFNYTAMDSQQARNVPLLMGGVGVGLSAFTSGIPPLTASLMTSQTDHTLRRYRYSFLDHCSCYSHQYHQHFASDLLAPHFGQRRQGMPTPRCRCCCRSYRQRLPQP